MPEKHVEDEASYRSSKPPSHSRSSFAVSSRRWSPFGTGPFVIFDYRQGEFQAGSFVVIEEG